LFFVYPSEFLSAVKRAKPKKQAAMLGLGFDADDGQTRITKGDNFLLYGGSKDTHAVMQETAVKINERLDERGMKLENAPRRELREITAEVIQQVLGSR
jgi:hypothetical protein